jgi:hypothetical protein
MKKVLGTMSKFVGGIFSLAVLALLMSLTYGALQRIFPGNFTNQMWGLVMFDIAAMCWALIFVFQSKSTAQYAAAGTGFLVGFVGTLGMVAAEVILSGQDLAQIDTGEIGKWMIYGFIVVTALHAALVYIHHGTAPEIAEQINVGVARGEVVSQAIKDATHTIEAEKQELSRAIYLDIVSQVKRDLGLHPVEGTPFERKFEQAVPGEDDVQVTMPANIWKSFSKSLSPLTDQPRDAAGSKPTQHPNPLIQAQLAQDEANGLPPLNLDYGPEWNASTDITPTLEAYNWYCQSCEGSNPAFTRKCQWCGGLRTNGSPVTAFSDIPPKSERDRPKDYTYSKPDQEPDYHGLYEAEPKEDQGDQPGPFPGQDADKA